MSVAAAALLTSSSSSNLTMSMEKLLEHAQDTGELALHGRNLKSFPKLSPKYRLKDTIVADLSRNKLNEVPAECTAFGSMEKFLLYHNSIKSIPDSVVALQSLQFLDLSRNQLSYLPATICQLPLQGLIVNNNRLVSLPEEIGRMQTLMELDASCNEIAHLPVQIGDLTALKSLNLRRNHLQEIPVEISYLQLTSLDLSGNRISMLPVELRFMTTVVQLNLEENPLTCPPANLCSRGRVHIFKYLEIQAIKEDRKRGVLTDSEYRRSYRKTGAGQLNDLKFNNAFGSDARRKRHTADSGYGSEQPLDRRWSQEFSQEVMDNQTEDARRLVLRAAAANPPPVRPPFVRKNLLSSGSSTSSSAYSSLNGSTWDGGGTMTTATANGCNEYSRIPSFSPSTASSSSSSSSSSATRNGLEDIFHKMIDGMFISQDNEGEQEENRRAAQKVFGKQGDEISIIPSKSRLPRHTHPLPTPSSNGKPLPHQPNNNNNSNNDSNGNASKSSLPTPIQQQAQQKPNVQTYRQYKEQLRQQRLSETYRSNGDSDASAKTRHDGNGIKFKTNGGSNYDVKTMQKEAVLSYVKSKSAMNGQNNKYSGIPQPNKLKNSNNNDQASQRSFSGRREAEKSATSDTHINHLRANIESRLRLTLPEDLAGSLVDGVILCHMANHVKPRSVPSIHVPSPAVPKLTMAKCKRNVENFLLACRKLGVRDELICSPSDILEPRKQGTVRISISIAELLRFQTTKSILPLPPPPIQTPMTTTTTTTTAAPL